MKILLIALISTLISASGHTDEIHFETLNIERFLVDIPWQCHPVREIRDCIVHIDASSDYRKDIFIDSMLDIGCTYNGGAVEYGILCAPKVNYASINVYTTNPIDSEIKVDHLKFTVENGRITALKIWNKNRLLCDVQGRMGRDRLSGKYYFLSGKQTIYKGYKILMERTSDYTDRCEDFIEREKVLVDDETEPYYKITRKEYHNWCYELCLPLSERNYRISEDRAISDIRYHVETVRYEQADGTALPVQKVLFASNPPYVIFKTSIIENDGRTIYMALFDNGDGIFFSSNDPHLQSIRYGHAFNYAILGSEKCNIVNKKDYAPIGPQGTYDISMDPLSNVLLNGHLFQQGPVYMTQYDIPYDSWLKHTLQQRIKEENEAMSEQEVKQKRIMTTLCPY